MAEGYRIRMEHREKDGKTRFLVPDGPRRAAPGMPLFESESQTLESWKKLRDVGHDIPEASDWVLTLEKVTFTIEDLPLVL